MTRRRAAAFFAFGLLACPSLVHAQPSPGRVTPASVDALHRWVAAVTGHKPGQPDESVRALSAMTYGARLELLPAYELFMRVMRRERVSWRYEIEKGVIAFAEGVRNNPGTPAFVRRAAILHGDTVVFAGSFPAPPDDAPPIGPASRSIVAGDPARIQRPPDPPLLTNETVTLTRDGQVLGDTKINWNLPFARSLLKLLLTGESTDDRPFVSDWYHAVSAYLFSKGMNGDAKLHLKDSARALPDDGLMAPLQQLSATHGLRGDDPWWDYSLGAGRDATALLEALWARAGRPPQ